MVGLSEIPESEDCNEYHMAHYRVRKVHSKDTLDIQSRCENIPLKSCILISKGDGSDEKISVKKAKSVHFADTLGKPLKSVKTLVDPSDDVFGLNFLSLRSSTRRSFSTNDIIFQQKNELKINEDECLNFKYPLEFKDLKTRVENENVCLDKISFIRGNGIFGTVVVKNVCFQKQVSIKYTFDNWISEHTEIGKYISSSCVENADTFSFEILPKQHSNINEINIIFAICFTANGMSYWDSNFGNNYSVLYKTEKQNGYSVSEKHNGFILPKQNFIGWAT